MFNETVNVLVEGICVWQCVCCMSHMDRSANLVEYDIYRSHCGHFLNKLEGAVVYQESTNTQW